MPLAERGRCAAIAAVPGAGFFRCDGGRRASAPGLKPSNGQRSNEGIKSLAGIIWFELDLQATLPAIQEHP